MKNVSVGVQTPIPTLTFTISALSSIRFDRARMCFDISLLDRTLEFGKGFPVVGICVKVRRRHLSTHESPHSF